MTVKVKTAKTVKEKTTKTTLKALKRKVWSLCSIYNRTKFADELGNVPCVSCGTIKHWKEMDAGHFYPMCKSHQMKYHPYNIHAQCKYCNGRASQGEQYLYGLAIDKTYGEGKAVEIIASCKAPFKETRTFIEYWLNFYELDKLKIKQENT